MDNESLQIFVLCSQCKNNFMEEDPYGSIISMCRKGHSDNHRAKGVTECPYWEKRERV